MSVTLHTTVGDIKLELYCDQAPKACENFLALCASDYYKNCTFHRNIKDFMVQTGDPSGLGKGGQSIYGVPFDDEFSTELSHSKRGILSMANNGPNTNKSQFFITYATAKHLDLKYTIFGHVIDGFDALEELESIKVPYLISTEPRIALIRSTLNTVRWSNSASRMSPSMRILSQIATRLRPSPSSFSSHSNIIHSSYRLMSSVISKPTNPAINISSPSSTPSELLERVRQSNEYYEQYIEEYTEELEEDREPEPVRPREEKKVARTLAALVEVLRDARALDIAVFSMSDRLGRSDQKEREEEEEATALSPPFTVVCSPMNSRHGRAVAAALSETAKLSEGSGTRRTSKRASGWLVVHVSEADTTVHVMDEEARRYFDLESMLSGAEDTVAAKSHDDIPDIPPPRV